MNEFEIEHQITTDLAILNKPKISSLQQLEDGLNAAYSKIKEAVEEENQLIASLDINDSKTRTKINVLAKKSGSSKLAVFNAVSPEIKKLEEKVAGLSKLLKKFVINCDKLSKSTKAPIDAWKAEHKANEEAFKQKEIDINYFVTDVDMGGAILPNLSISRIDVLIKNLNYIAIYDDQHRADELKQKKSDALQWLDNFKQRRQLIIAEEQKELLLSKIQNIRSYTKPSSDGGKILTSMSYDSIQDLYKQILSTNVTKDEFGDLFDTASEAKKNAISYLNQLRQSASIKEEAQKNNQKTNDFLNKLNKLNSACQEKIFSYQHAVQVGMSLKKELEKLTGVSANDFGNPVAVQQKIASISQTINDRLADLRIQAQEFKQNEEKQQAQALFDRLSYVSTQSVDCIENAIKSLNANEEKLLVISDQVKAKLVELNKQLKVALSKSIVSTEKARDLYQSIAPQMVQNCGLTVDEAKAAALGICKILMSGKKISGIKLELD
ncbi:MAG: hypothetical protein GY739_19350 [Mesoflavibacter sp.]|nr:hypothetical protein [Mesoflavibacter sp.]